MNKHFRVIILQQLFSQLSSLQDTVIIYPSSAAYRVRETGFTRNNDNETVVQQLFYFTQIITCL
jgi:hypothetical protein